MFKITEKEKQEIEAFYITMNKIMCYNNRQEIYDLMLSGLLDCLHDILIDKLHSDYGKQVFIKKYIEIGELLNGGDINKFVDNWNKEMFINNHNDRFNNKNANNKTFIYFIKDPGNNKIKIGFTKDINSRFKSHKTSNPDILFLGHIKGTMSLEKELHKKFKKYHYKLEWFNESQEIYNYIDKNCIKILESK